MSLSMGLTILASLGAFLTLAMNGFHSLWKFIYNNCISSATIHSSDQAYLYVMNWLSTNKISTDCQKFCLISKKNLNSSRVKRFSIYNAYNGRGGQDKDDDDDEENDLGPKLKYNPHQVLFILFCSLFSKIYLFFFLLCAYRDLLVGRTLAN